MSFNYVDAFNSSSQLEYESKQHDNSVELQGRRTYIFKLDKEKTEKSEIYNEAVGGRIYLPHFEQRALYNVNDLTGFIGTNNYIEKEDALSVEFNFARMVCNIRDLKSKIAGAITIQNNSKEILNLSTENNNFKLITPKGVVLLNMDLSSYKSIALFINAAMKACSLIKITYDGDSEPAEYLKSINMKLYPSRKNNIDVEDRLYRNCTDVIEDGDIILTDKYKLYQVNNAYPTGAMMNEYTSWTCKCNVVDLAIANLPDDYRKIVLRNEYGLPKTKME